jgi:hypothetical protein
VAVWVDWNDNLFFEESERVFMTFVTAGAQAEKVKGGFVVPKEGEMVLGRLAMRVAVRYEKVPEPCGVYSYGMLHQRNTTVTPL